ncbi:MAG: DUF58 domain-containing protein, partial [Nitrospira sp.]|nr:DUF58 domain-containing protein [Nitrospira sp.]
MLAADLVRKVRRIEISTKRLVDQGVAGNYHSAFKGRGVEFSEVRPYAPGDEIRTIDWNVTARMGEPFVKRFVEDADLVVGQFDVGQVRVAIGDRVQHKETLIARISRGHRCLDRLSPGIDDREHAALVSRLEIDHARDESARGPGNRAAGLDDNRQPRRPHQIDERFHVFFGRGDGPSVVGNAESA